MSIIIAKIENNQCVFISDTRVSINNGDKTITGDNKLRMSPNQGVLKIHILNPKICIAFAGNVEFSIDLIHSFIKLKPDSLENILLYFHDKLKFENDNSEFILGIIKDDKTPILFKVSSDKIEQNNSFWIGEKTAFSEFQSFFLKSTKTDSIIEKTKNAFNEMIKSTKIETVGDFIISAFLNTNINSFIYEEKLEVYGGYGIIKIKANESEALPEGTTEEGSFTVSNLISNNTGKPAVCLFFSKGKIGYLYRSISETNINAKPIIIDGNYHEVIEKVKLIYDIELIGMRIDSGKFYFR